jgi:tetratricopeptide (TPR) repeat protein
MKLSLILTCCAILLNSCNKFSDQELWVKIESAKANSNWDSTLQVSQLLLNEYPESQYASWARFGIAESYRFKDQPREALNNYKLFYEKFPDKQPSALSLFLVGYIYNNNLQIFDSAKVYYTMFLQKYPKHDLVPTVEFELKTLGKSADEALIQLQEKPKKIVKK